MLQRQGCSPAQKGTYTGTFIPVSTMISFAGHWGIDKTKELLERKFYWPDMGH